MNFCVIYNTAHKGSIISPNLNLYTRHNLYSILYLTQAIFSSNRNTNPNDNPNSNPNDNPNSNPNDNFNSNPNQNPEFNPNHSAIPNPNYFPNCYYIPIPDANTIPSSPFESPSTLFFDCQFYIDDKLF